MCCSKKRAACSTRAPYQAPPGCGRSSRPACRQGGGGLFGALARKFQCPSKAANQHNMAATNMGAAPEIRGMVGAADEKKLEAGRDAEVAFDNPPVYSEAVNAA